MTVQFDQKHEAALITALESIFGEGKVEVHDKPAALMTYGGRNATQEGKGYGTHAPPCHLIVRKETLVSKGGTLTNDAGYLRTEDGKYKAFIDAAGFSNDQQGRVSQEYAAIVSENELKRKGYMVQRQQADGGRIRLYATKY